MGLLGWQAHEGGPFPPLLRRALQGNESPMTDVVLALCFDCNSFLINPPDDQGHCASCLKTVGPSATLSRYTVPHGARVDLSGAVFAPDGRELLRSRRPE
jgi:hypothetical protein